MNENLKLGSLIANKDEKGNWIYKADLKPSPFKLNGVLKKHYSDLPRFKCIIQAEDEFMMNYNFELVESVKEMSNILQSFGH